MVWSHGSCVIGVSLFDELETRGLYGTFRDAAGLTVNNCATRAVGGMLRFAHFEVVVFDASVLLPVMQLNAHNFLKNITNLPFSAGLERLWRHRMQ